MRDIYQKATKVVVWLGPASEDSNRAFRSLAEASANKSEIEDWVRRQRKVQSHDKDWKAIHCLMSRDYWNRILIIQETFFARHLIVRCGFRCMQRSDFMTLFQFVMAHSSLVKQGIDSSGTIIEQAENGRMSRLIFDGSYIPCGIEDCRRLRLSGKEPPLESLLMTFRRSSSTDSRDRVLGIVGMSGHYGDRHAHKIDYSLLLPDTYIETFRCLMERRKHLGQSPLNIISFSIPHLSDGSLPSWVPDWSLRPDTKVGPGWRSLSGNYNTNGSPAPLARIDIYKGVLTVERFEIATVNHFGKLSKTSWTVPQDGSLDFVAPMRGMEADREAFYEALELAMSDSKSKPHSHKPSQVRMKEFALTMLCNNYDIYCLDPSITFQPNQPRIRPSEETIQEFCETIHFLGAHKTLIDWQSVLTGSRGLSSKHLLSATSINLQLARFCVSSTGSFVMAPISVRSGDMVCVLFGCDMPVVLRKKAENSYIFVGECYAHGIMDGEAIKHLSDGKYTPKTIKIY
jgi:hypothetical protein